MYFVRFFFYIETLFLSLSHSFSKSVLRHVMTTNNVFENHNFKGKYKSGAEQTEFQKMKVGSCAMEE